MALSLSKSRRLQGLANLASHLSETLRQSGDGPLVQDVLGRLGISRSRLDRDLAFLARLAPRGGLLSDQGLDAYVERGRVFYFGPLSRVLTGGLEGSEREDLRAAAGLLAGSFSPAQARFLRAFAGKGSAPRAPAAGKKAQIVFRALESGRTLVRPSGEILIPVRVAWYQGHPCLEVERQRKSSRQPSRFLLRLDRMPECRLGGKRPSSTPSPGPERVSRVRPGVRGRIKTSDGTEVVVAGSREELLRKVLRRGSSARVLGPPWLALAVRRRAGEALAVHL